MGQYNLSKITLTSDGRYIDANGNLVAKKGLPLQGAAWRYLKDKYGANVANYNSQMTRKGNVFLNGKWQPTNTKLAKLAKLVKSTEESPDSVIGWGILKIGNLTGHKISNTKADLLGTGLYFIPGVGSVLSGMDAVKSAINGNWGDAAMNAAFAIPFVGLVGNAARGVLRGVKAVKAAKAVGKGVNFLNKVKRPANLALNAHLAYNLPTMGKQMYDGYQLVSQAKRQYLPYIKLIQEAKLQGMTDELLGLILGKDNYKMITNIASTPDTFTGNMSTLWDMMDH